jgi:hypothetical protein
LNFTQGGGRVESGFEVVGCQLCGPHEMLGRFSMTGKVQQKLTCRSAKVARHPKKKQGATSIIELAARAVVSGPYIINISSHPDTTLFVVITERMCRLVSPERMRPTPKNIHRP